MSIDTFIYNWEPLSQSIFPESCLVLLPSPSLPTEEILFWYFHLGLVLHVLKLDINDINSVFFCVQVLFLNVCDIHFIAYINSSFLCIAFYSVIHLCHNWIVSFLFDIWVVSSLEILWIKLLSIFVYRSLCGKNSLG